MDRCGVDGSNERRAQGPLRDAQLHSRGYEERAVGRRRNTRWRSERKDYFVDRDASGSAKSASSETDSKFPALYI